MVRGASFMISRYFNKDLETNTNSILQVGLLLYVNEESKDSMKEEHILKSRIAEISDEFIAIEMPIEEGSGKVRFFPKDTALTAFFIDENGMRYNFSSNVIGKANENIPMLVIEKPEESSITKIQRRDYLRVPVSLNLTIILQNPIQIVKVKTIDLSGGGLSFSSPKVLPLERGQTVNGVIQLPHWKEESIDIRFFGSIRRVASPDEKRPVQLIAVQFEDIEERSRDQIIQLCFKRELELKRKLK